MADDLCSVEEAKEVYPRLGILANVGLVAAGSYVKFITRGVAAGNETLGLQVGGKRRWRWRQACNGGTGTAASTKKLAAGWMVSATWACCHPLGI
jgi:hypothetical protein